MCPPPFLACASTVRAEQAASSHTVNCVLFLFEGAAVDTATKYAFAVIGVFCMGFANEMIRYVRERGQIAEFWGMHKMGVCPVVFAIKKGTALFVSGPGAACGLGPSETRPSASPPRAMCWGYMPSFSFFGHTVAGSIRGREGRPYI